MGASKTYQYKTKTKNLAKIASALAHPARIAIVETLSEQKFIRNADLIHVLQLSKASIHEHVQKLMFADLICVEFYPNEYHISLKNDNLQYLEFFLNSTSAEFKSVQI